MGDAEGALPPSKKRAAGRQITQLDPEADDDAPEPEMGTFQKASEEVLATRRIVKVRRQQPPSGASSNPFAGIRLVPPTCLSARDDEVLEEKGGTNEEHEKSVEGKATESGASVKELNGTEQKSESEDGTGVPAAKVVDKVKSDAGEGAIHSAEVGEETGEGVREETKTGAGEETEAAVGDETEKGKHVDVEKDTAESAAPFSSFHQFSSQNAFTGLAGTGFSASSFSFGSIAKEGSTFGSSSGFLFGSKNENPPYPSFGIGSTSNGAPSLPPFGTAAPDAATKSTGISGIPSMQEMPIETGEENEKVVFSADAVLYEYLDGGWKERGKGELKVNISASGAGRARLVMRARGNYRLILNASLYPDMSLASMDKRGVTFACFNSAEEGKNVLTTFALKFRDSAGMEEFRGVVAAHQGAKAAGMKTPENSPKASDD